VISSTKEKNTLTSIEKAALANQPSVVAESNTGSNAVTAGNSQSAVKKIRP